MPINPAWVWIMVVGATFFWGSNFNAAHAIAGAIPPLTAAGERFTVAVMVLLLVRVWRGRAESHLSMRDQAMLVLLGLVGVFGFNYAFFSALQTTSALNGALIMALSPLLTTVLSAWLLGTGLPIRQLLGILLAFSGVALVITGGKLDVLQMARGDAWMLLACLLWSLYSVLLKRHAGHVPAVQQARWTIFAGALALILVALWRDQPGSQLQHQTLATSLTLVYMALCGTVLAYLFWLQGVQRLGPQRVAIAFNLVPVFTLLINLVLGQVPRLEQFAGLLLVFAGVWVASGWLPLRAERRKTAVVQ